MWRRLCGPCHVPSRCLLCHQNCGVPFDPVYIDSETGAWMAPGFNYMEKRADWQEYLDKKHNKKDYLTDAQIAEQQQQRQQQQQQAGATPGSTASAETALP